MTLKNLLKKLALIVILSISCPALILAKNSDVLIEKINFSGSKIEISLSQKTAYKAFVLKSPNRLVIDVLNGRINEKSLKNLKQSTFIKNFRHSKNNQNYRLVFELENNATFKNSNFDLKSKKISLNLEITKQSESSAKDDFFSQKLEEFEIETKKITNADGTAKFVITKTYKNRKPIIVIDAGHGGKDPGTIGRYLRSKEKNVTLSYAKELGKYLMKSGKYKVYLTRNDDRFIPLFQRVEIARKKKADLFISIHANAAEDRSVSGFSIYTLSEKASDKRAELLAKKENMADIINGVDFSGASQDIMKTLIDLSQRQSKNDSAKFANMAVKAIKNGKIEILQNSHRFAGFAVLTAPDMASTLIELGYLSNKQEEKLLNNISYKKRVAQSLSAAVDEYFAKNKIN
jgi:N-acetylmuramoyl-L-alanine amidase